MSLRALCVGVASILLVAGCGREESGSEAKAEVRAAPSACEAFRALLPANVRQGFVTLPEDPSEPSGPEVRVFYYVVPPSESPVHATPIAFVNGGPAESSWSSYAAISAHPASTRFEWVFFDQRGTGCSSAYPEGDRLRHYTTVGIVRDAEAVRTALYGDRPWRVFGHSHGAYAVHRYLQMAPESIAAAYAHGDTIVESDGARKAHAMLAQDRVFRGSFRDAFAERGDAVVLLGALKERLVDVCVPYGAIGSHCGSGVLDALAGYLAFRQSWDFVFDTVETLFETSEAALPAVVAAYFSTDGDDEGADVDEVRGLLNDYESFFTEEGSSNWCDEGVPLLEATGVDLASLALAECRFAAAFRPGPDAGSLQGEASPETAPAHRHPQRLAPLAAALAEHPSLRFHVYAGSEDTISPVALFDEMRAALGDRVRFTVVEGDHVSFLAPEIWRDLADGKSLEKPVSSTR